MLTLTLLSIDRILNSTLPRLFYSYHDIADFSEISYGTHTAPLDNRQIFVRQNGADVSGEC